MTHSNNSKINKSRYQLITEKERQLLLSDFNDTSKKLPALKSLPDLFVEQAKKNPENIAVIFKGNEITYRELETQSRQLALYLQENGGGADKLVGIYMNRSIDMVVAILAVLRLGAGYVPIDPGYPKERINLMFENSQVKTVITDKSLIDNSPFLKSDNQVQVLCFDEKKTTISNYDGELNVEIQDSSLAYVIYTSGSTGRPKGVMLSHGNLSNFLFGMQERLCIKDTDAFISVTPISFDLHVTEFYMSLMSGARLILTDREEIHSPKELFRLINQFEVTHLQSTPTTWKMGTSN